MKKEKFTNEEIELLKVFINIRIENDRKLAVNIKHKYIKALHSAYEKLMKGELSDFNSIEKIIFCSVVNENLPMIRQKLTLNTCISWINISEEQKKVIFEIDNCTSILEKCGFYKRNKRFAFADEFRLKFSKRIELIEKLKKSEGIFLSKAEKNDYYKIAFVYKNREYAQFELKSPLSLNNIEFTPFNSSLSSRYTSSIMTKKEASECLLSCEKDKYPEDVLEYYQLLLN